MNCHIPLNRERVESNQNSLIDKINKKNYQVILLGSVLLKNQDLKLNLKSKKLQGT